MRPCNVTEVLPLVKITVKLEFVNQVIFCWNNASGTLLHIEKKSIVLFEKRKLNTIKKVVLQVYNQDVLLQYELKVALHFPTLRKMLIFKKKKNEIGHRLKVKLFYPFFSRFWWTFDQKLQLLSAKRLYCRNFIWCIFLILIIFWKCFEIW